MRTTTPSTVESAATRRTSLLNPAAVMPVSDGTVIVRIAAGDGAVAHQHGDLAGALQSQRIWRNLHVSRGGEFVDFAGFTFCCSSPNIWSS